MTAHLSIRILPREAPLDGTPGSVAAFLPGTDLATDRSQVRHASIQALSREDADLDLGHVQPAGVRGRVVKLDTAQQAPCSLDTEHFLKAAAKVGIEVVHHQMYPAGGTVDVFEQMAGKSHKVRLGASLGHEHAAPASLGFDRHKQIAGPLTPVLVVLAQCTARPHRQRSTAVCEQLRALLVQAHHRFTLTMRPSIQSQQLVHALSVLLGQRPDAPHQSPPGFETVFFRSRRIVSRLICFIPGCARAARSNSSSVQRFAPAGGAEHASAVICASTSVRYLRGLPDRCSSATPWSRPPSRYAARVRQIIVRPTPSTCMICASGTCRANAESTCARLTSRAIRHPFERIASIVRRSFVASRNSVWRMATRAS